MALSLDPFKGDYKTLEKEEWIVVEKVHGANFGCYTNGKECKFARRRDFLKENEGFYNYKKADFMKDFPDKALQIYHRVQEWVSDKEVGQVILFGEIFGGETAVFSFYQSLSLEIFADLFSIAILTP